MGTGDARVLLVEWIRSAGDRARVLPSDDGRGTRIAAALGVSPRSMLDAVARHAGGIAVDDGWLRILAGGAHGVRADLASWNGLASAPVFATTPNLLVVAFDVLGGVFALDGGALGGADHGAVHFFAPDSLRWEPLGAGYSAWLEWSLTDEAGVASFYEDARWHGWRDEVRRLTFEEAIHMWPPSWTREGKDRSSVSRRVIAAHEVVEVGFAAARELDSGDVPGPRLR